MRHINFLSNEITPALIQLQYLWSIGSDYQQAADELHQLGFYLPKDQWELFTKLVDVQVELDIGSRQNEGK